MSILRIRYNNATGRDSNLEGYDAINGINQNLLLVLKYQTSTRMCTGLLMKNKDKKYLKVITGFEPTFGYVHWHCSQTPLTTRPS